MYEHNFPIRKGSRRKEDPVKCLRDRRLLANERASATVSNSAVASLMTRVSSHFDHRSKSRSAIPLPFSILLLVTIASLLAYGLPLDFRHVISAFLLLLSTVHVVISAMKIDQEVARSDMTTTATATTAMPTLREFLSHPDGYHMSFAPAFFGFYAYFGALAAMEEGTDGLVVPASTVECHADDDVGEAEAADIGGDVVVASRHLLRSVSGASAGAMAAVMLAAGIQPREAYEFASAFTWEMIADPPGFGGYARGHNFEGAMRKFIWERSTAKRRRRTPPAVGRDGEGPDDDTVIGTGLRLEEGLVPVAVSAFDLMRMKGSILIEGCMARAARSSAGFPGLFQPVAWRGGRRVGDRNDGGTSWLPDSLLIDGGITDRMGLNGLRALSSSDAKMKRVINIVVGDSVFRGPSGVGGMTGVNAEYLVSIAIVGTPVCGPWAMKNGPRAFESARKAMAAALDQPMERGTCNNHLVIRVDASKWLE
ncbi:hypothetical protein ACHAXA_009077 [Cyclostephanos tholiformis]|uniref:PNPLA domain-containing protein n=1 Tax=Cyclostephanos tholiformis TaxID=382380 RepID=A0ABD3SQK3_9STRA